MKKSLENLYIALGVCVVIIFGLATVLAVTHLRLNRSVPIIGVFLDGYYYMPHTVNLVFDDNDGTYALFRQFEMIENGTFEPFDDAVYILHSEDGENVRYAVRSGNDVVYLFLFEDGVRRFERLSDTPNYDNAPPPRH